MKIKFKTFTLNFWYYILCSTLPNSPLSTLIAMKNFITLKSFAWFDSKFSSSRSLNVSRILGMFFTVFWFEKFSIFNLKFISNEFALQTFWRKKKLFVLRKYYCKAYKVSIKKRFWSKNTKIAISICATMVSLQFYFQLLLMNGNWSLFSCMTECALTRRLLFHVWLW